MQAKCKNLNYLTIFNDIQRFQRIDYNVIQSLEK